MNRVSAGPDLTTIVVNWNTVDLLDECIESILAATPVGIHNQIVVVDNGSTDGSVTHLRTRWPTVDIIDNAENLGFCRANNQAILATHAPALLLVNTDARLQPGNIRAFLDYFARFPAAAIVGPRLVYGDGTYQRWTAGRLPDLRAAATFLLGLDRFGPWRHAGLYLGSDVDQAFQPEWVSSAVMAVRRAALDDIGLLDERIFVYMDDVDLCDRAVRRGWQVWYAPETSATHFMNGSSRRAVGKVSPEALRALNRWYVQRNGTISGLALRALELTGFGARVLLHSVNALRRRPDAKARRTAHAAYFRLALEPIDA